MGNQLNIRRCHKLCHMIELAFLFQGIMCDVKRMNTLIHDPPNIYVTRISGGLCKTAREEEFIGSRRGFSYRRVSHCRCHACVVV